MMRWDWPTARRACRDGRSPRWELLGAGAFLAVISTGSISGGPAGAFAAVISTGSISGGRAGASLPGDLGAGADHDGTRRWLRKAR
jgi:hypothetical protein